MGSYGLVDQYIWLRLDQTEPAGSQYSDNETQILHRGILFRGILEISRLSYLTEKGRQQIEDDLRLRDARARGAVVHRAARTGGLTLRFVYNSVREKIRVLIQGKKNLTVGYLTCRVFSG